MLYAGEIFFAAALAIKRGLTRFVGWCSAWAPRQFSNFVWTPYHHKIAKLTRWTAGINVTSYYLPTVLIESVGLTNNMARLLAGCNSVSYLLFSLIGIPNVERWGRRKMLMYAAAGQSVLLFNRAWLFRPSYLRLTGIDYNLYFPK